MITDRPVTGGIVGILQFIAIGSIGLAFVGGAVAGLSLGAEIILMVSVAITSALVWAASAAIQELRNIAFNTRREDHVVPAVAPQPIELDDAAAMKAYGIEADGQGYRFGEYRYDNLRDAVAYAKKHKPASAFNVGGMR